MEHLTAGYDNISITSMSWHHHFEDILPKGPYLPCVSMAGRALLAGYPLFEDLCTRARYQGQKDLLECNSLSLSAIPASGTQILTWRQIIDVTVCATFGQHLSLATMNAISWVNEPGLLLALFCTTLIQSSITYWYVSSYISNSNWGLLIQMKGYIYIYHYTGSLCSHTQVHHFLVIYNFLTSDQSWVSE